MKLHIEIGELLVYSPRMRWTQRLLPVVVMAVMPWAVAAAQTPTNRIVPCDLDIDDNSGNLVWGNTMHLQGAPGTGTSSGSFRLINGNTPEQDVDRDGYALACDYTALIIPANGRTPLVNVANQALAIPPENVVVQGLPHVLLSGQEVQVSVHVEVPPGTPAGVYRGSIAVRDSLKPPYTGSNGQALGIDAINIEVTVTPQNGLGLLNADTAKTLDSLTLRGRAGQRVQGVFRVVNLGNASLSDVRVSATDLQSESAVGIRIPSENISFSAPSLASIALGDTARLTIAVNIPRGILGGRYRGAILVQGQGAAAVQIPLIVIVSASRGIVFENNPVRNINGVGRIAFNGDPGTQYQIAIFDMNGLLVYTTTGTIYPGAVASGAAAGTTGPGADFAAAVTWPLTNGRGDAVASGMYLVVVNSIVNGQRQLAKDKLMVIR